MVPGLPPRAPGRTPCAAAGRERDAERTSECGLAFCCTSTDWGYPALSAHKRMPPYLLQRAPDPVNPRPPASVGSSRAARAQDHPDVRAVIPRRSALPVDRGVLIVAHATHKQKALFFFLVQARPRTRDPLRGLCCRAAAWRSCSGRVGAHVLAMKAQHLMRACRAAAARGVRRAAPARSARRRGWSLRGDQGRVPYPTSCGAGPRAERVRRPVQGVAGVCRRGRVGGQGEVL